MNPITVNSGKTRIIAHRGLSGLAPENTMPAFQLAVKNHYYGVECDIHVLKDGHFVITHDDNLKRMTGIDVPVSELTVEELSKMTVKSGNGVELYEQIKVPLLIELLELCQASKVVPIIEIKKVNHDFDLDRLVALVKEYQLFDLVTFISFNLDYLIYIRKNEESVSLQYLVGEVTDEVLSVCKKYHLDLDVHFGKLTKEKIEASHNNQIKVNAWTVDDLTIAQNLIDHRIDFITSNILIESKK